MDLVRITVCLITWNSARTLKACLRSLEAQTLPFDQILALDNASTDDSVEVLKAYPGIRIVESPENLGFAAGFNRLFALAGGDWVLLLNPDARLSGNFHEKALALLSAESMPLIGMIAPKILRAVGEDLKPLETLDSAGIRWNLLFRHLDRGSNEKDQGQFDGPGWVFGPTGAVALYRRAALDSVSLGGQVLDERFFAYREDADLAFRLQWKGVRCRYTPDLRAWHERRVLPERRNDLPPELNYHSLKNRGLLRLKNLTLPLWLLLLPTTVIYELFILLYCLLFERTSLKAYAYALRTLPSSLRWRRHTLKDKRVSSWYIFRYFIWPRQKK
jgi:GT2 family glycosyltransferase